MLNKILNSQEIGIKNYLIH